MFQPYFKSTNSDRIKVFHDLLVDLGYTSFENSTPKNFPYSKSSDNYYYLLLDYAKAGFHVIGFHNGPGGRDGTYLDGVEFNLDKDFKNPLEYAEVYLREVIGHTPLPQTFLDSEFDIDFHTEQITLREVSIPFSMLELLHNIQAYLPTGVQEYEHELWMIIQHIKQVQES